MKQSIFGILSLLLILFYSCKKDEPDPMEVLFNTVTTGTWYISEVTIGDTDLTSQFEPYSLTFTREKDPESPQQEFNRLILSDGSNIVLGTWIFMAAGPGEEYKTFLSTAFVNNSGFQPISARWGVKSYSDNRIELIKPSEEFSTDTRLMVLVKQ